MRGRIIARGASWQLIYDLPRGADGRRQQCSCTVAGPRAQAERELRRRLAEVDAGKTRPGRQTVAAYLEGWLAAMHGRVSDKTHEGLSIVVRVHLAPHWQRVRLDALTASAVRDFVTVLQTTGSHQRGRAGGPLAPVTVHRIGSVLRQALEEAVDLGLLARNPARVKLPPPRPQPKRVLTVAEIGRVLREARDSYLHTLILLGVATGARRGELLALRWEDVDLDTGAVWIRRSLVEVGGAVGAKEPKTAAGTRTLVLPAFARAELRHHKGRQAAWRLECGPIWQDHGLIVCREDGRPVRPSTASVRMRQLMDRLDLPGVTLHGLRHGFASHALLNGLADLKTLSTALGHANVNVTLNIYRHLLGGEMETLAAGMETVLGKVLEG